MDMMLEQFKTIFDRPEKVNKLRETILDLAVRGKLVPQDPNDEPASVLFEKIKNEKEILIKEKKIKKEKPLAEISENEKPFELPTGWEFVRIGDLGNIFNGNSINAKIKETVYANVEEGYNYISTKDVAFNGKGIDYNTGVKVPYNEKKFKVAHNGSVLICSEGGSAGRKIGLTDKDICFGNKLYAIEPIKGILSEYIFYIYQSSMFFDSFTSKMTGIIGGISIANFKEIIIPLCSLNEQKRIIEKVDSLMAFCDKLEKVLEKKVYYGKLGAKSVFNAVDNVDSIEELEEVLRFILLNFKNLSLGDNAVKELKNCILQLAVQGKLVPQDPNDEPASVLLERIKEEKERLIKEKKIKKEKPLAEISEEEKPFELPGRWEWVRLKEIGYNLGQKKPDIKFTYIDVGSINKEKGEIGEELTIIEPENAPSRARKLVDKGTVIYSTVRPYLLNIAIVDKEFEFEPIVSTAFAIIHPYEGLIVNIFYTI
ncbi:restriction modification system DNA specificity domain-containing protein [Clostridium sartagoforme AAU1]|uniref:Restriction modification system DNA specificity domain-containing protein n=1 Tax=Clostridium sartagoforme AAU1 TaxID=1202534 RepID=R9BT21_9CLOT|nr:restriction endonuclease subunit S [Clostridium sartagoforme]EOR20162.1 restriction modification system DNA specificity domain-containing protein [Clostridium sartagoforme AAU1]